MYRYKIEKQYRTTVVYCHGNIEIGDMKVLMDSLSKDPDFNQNHSIIVDFRNCNLDFHHNDLHDLLDYVENELSVMASRRTAYLTSKPNEVVLTKLYADMIKPHQIEADIFSTGAAAINFVGESNLDPGRLEDIISELKRNE